MPNIENLSFSYRPQLQSYSSLFPSNAELQWHLVETGGKQRAEAAWGRRSFSFRWWKTVYSLLERNPPWSSGRDEAFRFVVYPISNCGPPGRTRPHNSKTSGRKMHRPDDPCLFTTVTSLWSSTNPPSLLLSCPFVLWWKALKGVCLHAG